MAYQMLQAGTPESQPFDRYNGPYTTGEEYEQLLQFEKQQDKLWEDIGLDDGNE